MVLPVRMLEATVSTVSSLRKQQVPNYISIKVCEELYGLIARDADKNGVGLIDVVVRVVAEHFKRPDLGFVPRKPQGRKRIKQLA